ncbi:hypothetical protein C8Q80DRAFT_1268508 [Daedaleopsis nitida]|nr:hypothetical protein C8Q80DRAFT_1268508 [Daedaleopsis nitida]
MPKQLELNIYCANTSTATVIVDSDSSSVDIKVAVRAALRKSVETFYLLQPGTVKWSESEREMLDVLKQCDLNDGHKFERLLHHDHVKWLERISWEDLHILVMPVDNPTVAILDMDTHEIDEMHNVLASSEVCRMLPDRGTYTVYKCPEGMICPQPQDVASFLEALDMNTLEEVSKSERLKTIAPWGLKQGDLHFIITKATAHPDELASRSRPAHVDIAPEQVGLLQAVYVQAWGKPWASTKRKIRQSDIDLGADDAMEVDDVPPSEWSYTCLLDIAKLRNTVFASVSSLDDNPALTDFIVVRDDYKFLLKAMEGRTGSMILTGQPGIGKTTFLLYVLLYRLERMLPTIVQFTGSCIVVFDKEGATVHATHAGSYVSDGCWALVDSNNDTLTPCSAVATSHSRIFLASSPKSSSWHKYKVERSPRIAVTELPTLYEIAAIASERQLDSKEAVALALKWGPSIQTVLNLLLGTIDERECQRIAAKAARYVCDKPNLLLNGDSPAIGDSTGSSIVFVRPIRSGTPSSDATPAGDGSPAGTLSEIVYEVPTQHLAEILNAQRLTMARHTLFKLYDTLSTHSLTRPAAGWIFEKHMHIRMSTPGTAVDIVNSDGVRQEMQPAVTLLPGTVGALSRERPIDVPFYWFPSVVNFPGIDGVLVNSHNVYVLQATVAVVHDDPKDGMRKVWKAFGATNAARYSWHFVAVTDQDESTRWYAKDFAAKLNGLLLGEAKKSVCVWGCVLPVVNV